MEPAMKIVTNLLVVCSLAVAPLAMAQTINQWKDPKTGNTIFSDQPPPPGTNVVERRGSEPGTSGQQSYATRMAAEKFPVVLYTTAECLEQCAKGRDLLNGRGIPFAEKIISSEGPELTELRTLTGGETVVPVVVVGKQPFKGFDPAAWNNLLDLAGYPKSAPYGSKPSGAFAR